MAEEMVKRLVGINPQGDFVEAGLLPRKFRGLVTLARFIPRPMKKDGAKHALYALVRMEDVETEKLHDVWLRAGWLPRRFEDGHVAGTMPTNDASDVDDADREPTASVAFFMQLSDGTRTIPADVDAVTEYGGKYLMGDPLTTEDQLYKFMSALAQCDFQFSGDGIDTLEGWTLTVESTVIDSYQKDGKTREVRIHLPIEADPPKKTKKTTGKKTEPEPEPDEEEEEAPKSKPKATTAATTATTSKKKAQPEPEEEEEEAEEEDEQTPAQVLEAVIIGILKGRPNREMPEGQVLIEAMRASAFRELSQKDRKAATAAYNDRSLFEDSEVLILDEDEDVVKLKKASKK